MLRRILCWSVVLFPLGLAGCSTDQLEGYITSTIDLMKHASNEVGTIKDRVNDAIKKAEDKKLSAKELKEATGAIDSLRELGKKMQIVKQKADAAGATITAEQKEEFRQRYQQKLNSALADLEEQRVALQKTLQEAEAMDAEGIRELRTQLTQAEGVFAVLARQR